MKKILLLFVIATPLLKSQNIKLPGDSVLPSSKEELEKIANYESGKYSYIVESFFENPSQSYFKISPDGKYYSYKQRESGKNHLYILKI